MLFRSYDEVNAVSTEKSEKRKWVYLDVFEALWLLIIVELRKFNLDLKTIKKLKEFIKSFEANVYKGCMQNPSKDLRNPSGHCKCYVQAFLKRYTPEQLVRINQAAGINSVAPQLIALMMKPEVEVCKAINR